ncbi:membrane-anchored junction protein-like isoform X2 [Polyodon spathula]|uniref:membrane-anchored junction protein-like isoform X2 n=1 Tax=Polyodon spathula TaxID=7913 RepID=UPI001B7E2A99|nr:membrane-anchored junction protein-like isoform X2 [Polyodon spathula]
MGVLKALRIRDFLRKKMPVNRFRCPFPETRFFHADSSVYKFRIRYGNKASVEDFKNKEEITQEVEDAIRVVLANLESVQPFATFQAFQYLSI